MRQFFSSKAFVWIIVAAVLGAAGYALILSGTPVAQRALQLDQRRVNDLQQILYAIDEYWMRNQKLPETLEELQDSRYYYVSSIQDPETQEYYEYRALGEKQFELCAAFLLETKEGGILREVSQRVWKHGVGRTCFELEVQPRAQDALPKLMR